MQPKVTFLFPCLNEAKTIRACIAEASRALKRTGLPFEIRVVDNGSTDESPQIATDCGAVVTHCADKGYGNALRTGLHASLGDVVIFADADLSYDLTPVDEIANRLLSRCDVVIGDRFAGRIYKGAMPPLHRYLGNPVLSWIGRRLFFVNVRDFHCGLRGITRKALNQLNLQSAGMEFASEFVAMAAITRLRIETIPVTLRPDGRDRAPHLRSWRDGTRHVLLMLSLAPWAGVCLGVAVNSAGTFAAIYALEPEPIVLSYWTINTVLITTFSTAIAYINGRANRADLPTQKLLRTPFLLVILSCFGVTCLGLILRHTPLTSDPPEMNAALSFTLLAIGTIIATANVVGSATILKRATRH